VRFKAIFLPGSVDGCALWRFFMPHLKLPGSKFVFNPGFVLPADQVQQVDVAVVQRLGTENNIVAIRWMKSVGKKVVYDLDDNLWNLPHYNPAAHAPNFAAIKRLFTACIQECDYVVASTNALQAAIKNNVRIKKPVRVINNAVDFDLFCPLPRLDTGMVTVGWGGSMTHDKDISDVYALIPELLEKNPRMRFESVGAEMDKNLAEHPRVRPRMAVPIAEYPSRLASWRWDVFLAPLVDNAFNRSKSNIKMLEAAALMKPILVSPVAPYSDFCKLDRDLEYLLCHTIKQWREKITHLVNDAEARHFYGMKLYAVARKHFDVVDMAKKWNDIFNEIS
jgi:glycosyltransferase involved in cell wall biosynthesis